MSVSALPLRHRFQTKVLCFAFLLITADILFYGVHLGISVAIFGALLLSLLVLTHPAVLRSGAGKVVAVLCVGLLGSFVWSPSLLSISMFAVGCATLMLMPRRAEFNPWLWLRDMLCVPVGFLAQHGADSRKISKLQAKKKTKKIYSNLWGYILFPLAFAVAFVFFFAKVNPAWKVVFEYIDILALLSMSRWFFWLVAGLIIWGFLRMRLMRDLKQAHTLPANLETWVSRTSLVLSLCLFNVIFAIQNGMDVNAFFQAAGVADYASRAQNAAYPLIFTVMLAAFYVLLVFDERQAKYHSTPAKYLTIFWVGQNIMLTLTAAYRNVLYIDFYSLTYLRLAAMIWLGLIVLGLVLIIWRLVFSKSNTWLVKGNLLALFSVLYLCCFVSFDRLIVDYNLAHSRQGGVALARSFDVSYALKIGGPALPALKKVYADSPSEGLLQWMTREYEVFIERQHGDWRSWTLQGYLLDKELPEFSHYLSYEKTAARKQHLPLQKSKKENKYPKK